VPPDRATLAAYVAIAFLGGANAVGIRVSNRELDPYWGAALRFGTAAAVLLLVLAAQKRGLPSGPALRGALAYGVLGFGAAYAFAYRALLEISAATGQVILALVPLLTLLLATLHGLERFRWRGLAGGCLALAGIWIVFREQLALDVPLAASAAALASAACMAEGAVVIKRYGGSDVVATNALAMTVGTAILLALSLVFGERQALPSVPGTWGAVLYLALAGSVLLFVLYLRVLARWTASATSYLFVLFPFVTAGLAALLLGERVSDGLALGSVLVLLGVFVGALWTSPRSDPSAPHLAVSEVPEATLLNRRDP